MRYLYQEQSADQKERMVFALGKQEAVLVYAMVVKAIQYMPKTPETRYDLARLRNMQMELMPLIRNLEGRGYTENLPKEFDVSAFSSSPLKRKKVKR